MSKEINIDKECLALGYQLRRNIRDSITRLVWRYQIGPNNIAGGYNYCNSKDDVIRWIENVRMVRAWQNDATVTVEKT